MWEKEEDMMSGKRMLKPLVLLSQATFNTQAITTEAEGVEEDKEEEEEDTITEEVDIRVSIMILIIKVVEGAAIIRTIIRIEIILIKAIEAIIMARVIITKGIINTTRGINKREKVRVTITKVKGRITITRAKAKATTIKVKDIETMTREKVKAPTIKEKDTIKEKATITTTREGIITTRTHQQLRTRARKFSRINLMQWEMQIIELIE
jgi:hypothetical protein